MQIYSAAADDAVNVKRIAEESGFCLVKQVFSSAQMATLQASLKQVHSGKSIGGSDIMSHAALRWMILEPHVLKITRALVGSRPVYYGSSSINYEEAVGDLTLNPYNALHCDARGMPTSINAQWRSDTDGIFRGYRFAVYMQDYSTASGGLKVAIGSHRGDPAPFTGNAIFAERPSWRRIAGNDLEILETRSPLYNLPSQAGDLVIWNLRTFHSGGARRFVGDPEVAVHPAIETALHKQSPGLFHPQPGPRNALFFDYGAPVEEVDLYIKHVRHKIHPLRTGTVSLAGYDLPEPRAEATRHDIDLRHDVTIVGLACQLMQVRKWFARGQFPDGISAEKAGRISEQLIARLRLLLSEHHEFSLHFPLLPPEIVRALAQNTAASFDDALAAILASH